MPLTMQMKHPLRTLFIDTETFLKCFMKLNGITYEQYQKDMDTFLEDSELIQTCQKRVVDGLDMYPYLYVLHKSNLLKPLELANFCRYFTGIANKQAICETPVRNDIKDILTKFNTNPEVLYLVSAMQYYFL